MTEQIPAEAVEAAARAIFVATHGRPGHECSLSPWEQQDDGVHWRYTDKATAALAAALPYLAQPARVVPSVEEVAAVLYEHRGGYWTDVHGWEWAGCQGCEWGREVRITRGPGYDAHRNHQATLVLALFASQATVADVREQAARDIEDDPRVRPLAGHDAIRDAASIARGETKGDNHG